MQGRIQDFPLGGVDPFGGGGGVDLRCGCISVKMNVKMKELGPIGGRAGSRIFCRGGAWTHLGGGGGLASNVSTFQ